MTITEAMQNDDFNLRVSTSTRWLVWHEGQWQVFERRYGQKKTRVLARTDNEADAINALVRTDSEEIDRV